MNVDWLEDETIFYLDEDDLKKLLESESVWKHKEEQIPSLTGDSSKERTFSAQLSTSSSTQSSERYDDCLLALKEAVAFIRTVEELGMGQQSFRTDYFDLNKVKNTYEHYREMQKKYELEPTDYYVSSYSFFLQMKSEDDIEKAFALAAKAANDLEENQPAQAAGPFILMKGLGWVLDKDVGEDIFDGFEEEFQELLNDNYEGEN